jgi:hypothetical protein
LRLASSLCVTVRGKVRHRENMAIVVNQIAPVRSHGLKRSPEAGMTW